MTPTRLLRLALPLLVGASTLAACSTEPDADLVIYSGRSESLVGPIIADFEEATGLTVEVRYGDTAEMTAQLLEEGSATPADVFFSQDAGALGALSDAGALAPLSDEQLSAVPALYASLEGDWVGVTGRARVIAYDPDAVSLDELPDDISEFTEPQWRGKVAIAPTNASFQAFVTALRVTEGEAAAEEFLRGLVANDVQIYENNLTILDALEAGEISVGLVNHYYLHELKLERGEENVRTQLKFLSGGAGALVNVAGVAVLADTSADGAHDDAAAQFVDFLLDADIQAEFVAVTGEYPLVPGVAGPEGLPSLAELGDGAGIDLAELHSLQDTIALLTEVGLI